MSTADDCTVCTDPSLCAKHGLVRQIVGRGPECRIQADDRTAFLYRILIRLAAKQGVSVSDLMGDDAA